MLQVLQLLLELRAASLLPREPSARHFRPLLPQAAIGSELSGCFLVEAAVRRADIDFSRG